MPCLRSILSDRHPLLVLDAASTRIQVGVLEGPPAVWRWQSSSEEAGVGLFTCLNALGFNPATAKGFLFCEGPGSILGIRSAAAALRAWLVLAPDTPVWSYRSLDLALHSIDDTEARVIADARRDSWHMAKRTAPMRRVPSSELGNSQHLYTPENFRSWSKLPPGITAAPLPYDLQPLLPKILDVDLFLPAPEPDAFLHEEPSYATWTPQIHRAPEPTRPSP